MPRALAAATRRGRLSTGARVARPWTGLPDARLPRRWLDLPGAAARLRWLSELCGLDLVQLGTTADADEIRDTAVTQPLLVALGLVAAAELELADVTVTAGHSVGEIAAAALAGVFGPEAAVALARLRGREMAAACALAPTGMSAVLGGDPDEVLARLDELGLTPANRNGAGQIVAAGPRRAARRAGRRAAGRRPGDPAVGGRRVPHRRTWPRPRRLWPRSPTG